MISEIEVQHRYELYNRGYWEIPDNLDTTNFDFSWRPDPWDRPYIHQFGTQHQKTGGPRFVVPENEGIKYHNFQIATKLPDENSRCWRPLIPNITIDYSWHPDDTEPPFIYVFGNQWYDSTTMPSIQYRVKGATQKKYMNDIHATLLPSTDNWEIPEHITDFDYSWVPSPYEPPYIQQFGTEWGDDIEGPKYIVKDSLAVKQNNLLIAKSNTDKVADQVVYEDSIFDAYMEHTFTKPLVHIKRLNSKVDTYSTVCPNNGSVHVINGTELIISRNVSKSYFYDKITDYENIIYHYNDMKYDLLDIVFFSNGENCAEENYNHLLSLNLPNRIVRVDGVVGRVKSQHAAANVSNTPWYFLVNAKLRVNEDFDFRWQPNVLKSRRHYIFRASNPLNGLEYGHQAIVANNKKLTLTTVVRGLDFTMDSPHEVVNINSGIGMYNTSIWDTWRTSFRECIKLCHATDEESKRRLNIWSTVAEGDYAELSLRGASDAIDYYKEVNGDLEKLKLSYDWAWLQERFNK